MRLAENIGGGTRWLAESGVRGAPVARHKLCKEEKESK